LILREKISSGDAVWIYGSGTFAGQVAARAVDLGLEVLAFAITLIQEKLFQIRFKNSLLLIIPLL
jgi:hypothetical protein